jgi:hypothetical protein
LAHKLHSLKINPKKGKNEHTRVRVRGSNFMILLNFDPLIPAPSAALRTSLLPEGEGARIFSSFKWDTTLGAIGCDPRRLYA